MHQKMFSFAAAKQTHAKLTNNSTARSLEEPNQASTDKPLIWTLGQKSLQSRAKKKIFNNLNTSTNLSQSGENMVWDQMICNTNMNFRKELSGPKTKERVFVECHSPRNPVIFSDDD